MEGSQSFPAKCSFCSEVTSPLSLGLFPLLLNVSESTLGHQLSLLSPTLMCPEVPRVRGTPNTAALFRVLGSASSAKGPKAGWHCWQPAPMCSAEVLLSLRPSSCSKLLSNVSPSARATSFSHGLHGKKKTGLVLG